MSFKIITEDQAIETTSLIAVIYGEPGIGKTSVSFTTESPILLDFDGGIQRAANRKTAVRVNNWEGVTDLINSKEFAKLNPKTIIVDTAGTMLDNYIADYVKRDDPKNSRRGGELSLQGYGAMKSRFQQFVNWAKSQKKNVVFIAHADADRSGDDTQWKPKLTGGSYDILRESADLVGFMYASKNSRVINFTPSANHVGKDCAEIGVVEVPHYSIGEYETFLQDLINRTLDKMNSLSEKQVEIRKMIEDYKEDIKSLTTADEANAQISLLAEEEKGVRIQMFNALRKHCETVGVKYSGREKKFYDVKPVSDEEE